MTAKQRWSNKTLLHHPFFTLKKRVAYILYKSGQHLVFNGFFILYTAQPTCLSTAFVDNAFKNHKKHSKWAQSEYKMIINCCLKHFLPKTNALLIIYTNQVNTLFLMIFSCFIQCNPHAYPQLLWTMCLKTIKKQQMSAKWVQNDHKPLFKAFFTQNKRPAYNLYKSGQHVVFNGFFIIYTAQPTCLSTVFVDKAPKIHEKHREWP